MSTIMLGVLRMPYDLFWADDPVLRMQHDAVRLEAAEEVERLTAIVDKLPKTADGVPVTPGMDVWLNDDPTGVRCCLVDEVWLRTNRRSHVYLTFHGAPDGPWCGSDLYSAREAAKAAERGEG